MSDRAAISPDRESICEAVEKLAIELLIGPSEQAFTPVLAGIADAAERAGQPAVSGLARELCASAGSADGSRALYDGIAKLQAAIAAWDVAGSSAAGSGVAWEPEPAGLAQDPELVSDFIIESREHLDTVEARLLELERNPQDREAIHSVFRSFHTVKGLAGFLEFGSIRDVAHEVETVLDHVREGRLAMTPEVVDIVLASMDYLNTCLRGLETTGGENAPDNTKLIERVRAVACPPSNVAELLSSEAEHPSAGEPSGPAQPVSEAAAARAEQPAERAGKERKRSTGRSVKIDTEKLDYLVDMLGEMVIAQSLIRYDPDLRLDKQARLARNLSQLGRITNEVQRTAMSMRMVPIGGLFQKMARLVRDLTRKFGKQAAFESIGEDVELDRNIVEELADPLMHMIRNAVDHGIETAEERERSGKPPVAKVALSAMHQGGQILIQVRDDGRGLSREKILAKARQQGLVEPGAEPPDVDVYNLIFHPGFSTAEQLSQVSGRGVGMDVVRKQIQRLRGSIEIHSKPGQGTSFSLKLPLTLAIIDGLVVKVGDHPYVVPIFTVRELLRPAPDMIFTVENRSEMVLIRERLVPVVRLYQRFAVEPDTTDPHKAVFVLAECNTRPFCIMVDTVVGKQEIVIKSLGPMFGKVPGVAGGAILGDGHVALILDPSALFGGAGTEA